MVKKILYHPLVGMIICVLYLIIVKYLQSVYEVKKIMAYGREYQFSVIFHIIHISVLWLPVIALVLNYIFRAESRLKFENNKKVIQKYWKGFAVYLIVLLLILKSIEIGDMQYNIPLIKGPVNLLPSFHGYVIMMFLNHIFKSINAILFLLFVPFMYCMALGKDAGKNLLT